MRDLNVRLNRREFSEDPSLSHRTKESDANFMRYVNKVGSGRFRFVDSIAEGNQQTVLGHIPVSNTRFDGIHARI